MFAWHDQWAPPASPAQGMQSGPGVDRDAGVRVDHADLAHGAQRVGGDQRGERVGGALPRLDPVERVRPVRDLDDGLGRHRADARPGPDAERADREPVGLHGRSELPGGGVESDDRVGAVAHRARISA